MKYEPQFFQPKEFRCPCCHKGLVASHLVFFLDQLRRAWGGPIQVNSGWRCPKHNKEVGGAQSSRHLIGCAADITPVYEADLLSAFKMMVKDLTKYRADWEVIEYPWGMHVGIPREETAYPWDGGLITVITK